MPRARAVLDHAAIAAAFAPDGLHGVSASEVARRARVAKPTLYARGRSKDAVFLSCVQAEVERVLTRLDPADRRTVGQPSHQRAAALVLALLDHAAQRPAGFRLLHVTARHHSSTVAADVDRAIERIPDRIAAALRRGLVDSRAERVDLAARALHGSAAALIGHGEPGETAATLGRAIAVALRSPAPDPVVPRETIALDVY